jgi:very-short-patch-repair endonuclease
MVVEALTTTQGLVSAENRGLDAVTAGVLATPRPAGPHKRAGNKAGGACPANPYGSQDAPLRAKFKAGFRRARNFCRNEWAHALPAPIDRGAKVDRVKSYLREVTQEAAEFAAYDAHWKFSSNDRLCESKIERLFLAGLIHAGICTRREIGFFIPHTDDYTLEDYMRGCVQSGDWPACFIIVQPQAVIAPYRADFLAVALNASGPVEAWQWVSAVIECDGHDFHERTKEQAARDRGRDRAMTAAGLHVLRFTGSEIWKDPLKCATEAADFLAEKAGFGA